MPPRNDREQLIEERRRHDADLHDSHDQRLSKLEDKLTSMQIDIAFWKGKQAGAAFLFGSIGAILVEAIPSLIKAITN